MAEVYRARDSTLNRDAAIKVLLPAVAFDTKYAMPVIYRTYDVSADGQRFLMIKEGATDGNPPPASLVVVEPWLEELKRLLPAK